jgi:CubicO group peptidase (beta-lactamase class C family)
MSIPARLTAILHNGIQQKIFPGAVLVAASPHQHLTVTAGTYRYTDAIAVTAECIYDLASLTKIVTATAALAMCSRGWLSLDAAVTQFLPQSNAKGVTIRHLLTHTSGLDIRLSTTAQAGSPALWQSVLACAPMRAPGSVVAYANVNTLILGRVLEVISYQSLAQIVTQYVLQPAAMHETYFNPPALLLPRIPPSEIDVIRGEVCGTVHDESTAALGGVAGHAGLFGTAADMLRFGQAWLDTLAGHGPWGIDVALAQQALQNQSPAGQLGVGLGWMLARDNFMPAAVHNSMAAHTGFTGPVVAIVPQQQLVWALLSNRTWPQRTPPQHHAVTRLVGAVLLDL